jgi:hypothetical protein
VILSINTISPVDLLADLRRRGLRVRLQGGKVYVGPRDKMTEADRQAITAHKPHLVALLLAEQSGGDVQIARVDGSTEYRGFEPGIEYRLRLVPLSNRVPPDVRLRRLLKLAFRQFAFVCSGAIEGREGDGA